MQTSDFSFSFSLQNFFAGRILGTLYMVRQAVEKKAFPFWNFWFGRSGIANFFVRFVIELFSSIQEGTTRTRIYLLVNFFSFFERCRRRHNFFGNRHSNTRCSRGNGIFGKYWNLLFGKIWQVKVRYQFFLKSFCV